MARLFLLDGTALAYRSHFALARSGKSLHDLSGNTIDLLTRVLGFSFHDAMTEITRA